MSLPITISGTAGQWTAQLVGDPATSSNGITREDAISELRLVVHRKVQAGELMSLEVGSWIDLAGTYRDDESLDAICDEVYRSRSAELAE